MQRVADAGKLDIDLVAYPDVLEVENPNPSMSYTNRYRVGGVKLTIDGSPQGKTAWLTKPYHVPPEGQDKDYRGYAAIDEKTTNDAVEKPSHMVGRFSFTPMAMPPATVLLTPCG